MNTGNRCCGPTVIVYWRGDHSVAAYFVGSDRRSLALFLAIGRVSSNKYIQFPIGYLPIFFAVRRCMFSCWCSIWHVYAGDC